MSRGLDGIAAYENREMPTGLSPFETVLELKRWIYSANNYTKRRKNQFRLSASLVKLFSIALSATATIVLGLQHLDFWRDWRSPWLPWLLSLTRLNRSSTGALVGYLWRKLSIASTA
jgi:hypothetical protein